jgi:hypothetical protein
MAPPLGLSGVLPRPTSLQKNVIARSHFIIVYHAWCRQHGREREKLEHGELYWNEL